MKIRVKLILAIAVALALFLLLYLGRVFRYQKAVRALAFSEIDLSGISDGSYIGACDVDIISAKVEVTVQGGRITAIKLLEHVNDRGAAAERISDWIVAEQRLDVDIVAGATNSSKVIKKAVENALQ